MHLTQEHERSLGQHERALKHTNTGLKQPVKMSRLCRLPLGAIRAKGSADSDGRRPQRRRDAGCCFRPCTHSQRCWRRSSRGHGQRRQPCCRAAERVTLRKRSAGRCGDGPGWALCCRSGTFLCTAQNSGCIAAEAGEASAGGARRIREPAELRGEEGAWAVRSRPLADAECLQASADAHPRTTWIAMSTDTGTPNSCAHNDVADG